MSASLNEYNNKSAFPYRSFCSYQSRGVDRYDSDLRSMDQEERRGVRRGRGVAEVPPEDALFPPGAPFHVCGRFFSGFRLMHLVSGGHLQGNSGGVSDDFEPL